MEVIKISENTKLVMGGYDDNVFLFTDVNNLEYIEISAVSDYGYGQEIEVKKKKKINLNTDDSFNLSILVALGKITKEEKRIRLNKEKIRLDKKRTLQEQNEIKYKEKKEKEEYLRLKEKYEVKWNGSIIYRSRWSSKENRSNKV